MNKIIECIPNFSVSKEHDPETYQALTAMASSVPGCTLLDAQTDGDHNRCVFTMVGSPDALEEAVVGLAGLAARRIDMRKHKGQHPRMGATDVVPFVPAMNVSAGECIELSKRVGRRLWEELGIPVFLYEDSAERPQRRNLAEVRKGEFEGMPTKLLQEDWAPDFGERRIHPTAGVTAVGARMPLVAFNVNLDTDDIELAKEIARKVRASSGGFPYCKAIGVMLADRGLAQVSMNMVNYRGTPLYEVYDVIKDLAAERGVGIAGSEVVGLLPAEALIDCAEHYLKIENFSCMEQVMEYHLLSGC